MDKPVKMTKETLEERKKEWLERDFDIDTLKRVWVRDFFSHIDALNEELESHCACEFAEYGARPIKGKECGIHLAVRDERDALKRTIKGTGALVMDGAIRVENLQVLLKDKEGEIETLRSSFHIGLLEEIDTLKQKITDLRKDAPYSSSTSCPRCRFENGKLTYLCSLHKRVEELENKVEAITRDRQRAVSEVAKIWRESKNLQAKLSKYEERTKPIIDKIKESGCARIDSAFITFTTDDTLKSKLRGRDLRALAEIEEGE